MLMPAHLHIVFINTKKLRYMVQYLSTTVVTLNIQKYRIISDDCKFCFVELLDNFTCWSVGVIIAYNPCILYIL